MKHLLTLFCVFYATTCFAFTQGTAWNSQTQGQNGIATPTTTEYKGVQAGAGFSIGSGSLEGQMQAQGFTGSVHLGSAVHNYNTMSGTYGGSNYGAHVEASKVSHKMVTQGAGGVIGMGGADSTVQQGAATLGNASAGTVAKYNNSYKYLNAGANSYTYHEGAQYLNGATATSGTGISAYEANQHGATLAVNDGSARNMVGASYSKGTVDATNAHVEQGQYHAYRQEAVNGGAWQVQQGFTATYVAE